MCRVQNDTEFHVFCIANSNYFGVSTINEMSTSKTMLINGNFEDWLGLTKFRPLCQLSINLESVPIPNSMANGMPNQYHV